MKVCFPSIGECHGVEVGVGGCEWVDVSGSIFIEAVGGMGREEWEIL